MQENQIIYGHQYYIDPLKFSGRTESCYYIGTLKMKTSTYWIFDEVDFIVDQYDKEIVTSMGDNKKFAIKDYKVTY